MAEESVNINITTLKVGPGADHPAFQKAPLSEFEWRELAAETIGRTGIMTSDLEPAVREVAPPVTSGGAMH